MAHYKYNNNNNNTKLPYNDETWPTFSLHERRLNTKRDLKSVDIPPETWTAATMGRPNWQNTNQSLDYGGYGATIRRRQMTFSRLRTIFSPDTERYTHSCVDKQSNNHARLDDEASPPRALFAPPIKVIPLDTPEYKTLPFDPRCVGPLRDTPPEDVAFIDSSGWRFTVQRPLGGYTDVFHNAVINALTNHEWESTDQSLSETCQWDDEPANQTMSAERLDTGLACSTAGMGTIM
ncbi:hypothetical protein LSAT2_026976 [Lamellibrachia satsuma]|nr:hypothetical protein LSAT2_026976 [Lamellibrachia satsuma]